MNKLRLTLLLIYFVAVDALYTGPDGKIAAKGTPEHEANKYLKLIFSKYGVDLEVREEMGEHELAELMLNIGLGIIHRLPKTEAHLDHDHDRKRREVERGHRDKQHGGIAAAIFADSVSSIPHEHVNVSSSMNDTDCRSAPVLLKEYKLHDHVTDDAGIGTYQFGMLCPALLYLSDEKTCIEHELEVEQERPSALSVWGYGFLSVTLISLLSFLGVGIVPLISSSFFHSLLSVLVAGAVGALTGDALLHLLPHSQSSSHLHTKEPIFKNLVVLLGIYLLFVVEGIMKISQHRNGRKKQKKKILEYTKSEERQTATSREDDECVFVGTDGKSVDEEIHEHGEHGHTHNRKDVKGKGVASVAWMVIAGDGMHNFSDGVAIGAAFTMSLVGGMSTSVAVFCHELPHELGDFAMLLKAGMSVKQALFYNAVAASLGYLGMILGILVGNYAANVTPWIFAITAGMFLYVALVDMLPEMNSGTQLMKTKSVILNFVLQNIGLLTGVSIMLLIALFEENIEFK